MPRSLAAPILPAECVPMLIYGWIWRKGIWAEEACHHTLGMLQGGQSTACCFAGLLTHLPSCAFVQPRSTSLQRMAKTDPFTLLSCTHKSDWLQCSPDTSQMLTSCPPNSSGCVWMRLELLHAVPAGRRAFGLTFQ